MHWRDSRTYGIRELVSDAPTRQEERILGRIEMERGHIRGFIWRGCHERVGAVEEYYNGYGMCRPERYRAVERAVEQAAEEANRELSKQ